MGYMDGRHILFKKETSITLFRDLIIVLIAWTNLTDKFSGVNFQYFPFVKIQGT